TNSTISQRNKFGVIKVFGGSSQNAWGSFGAEDNKFSATDFNQNDNNTGEETWNFNNDSTSPKQNAENDDNEGNEDNCIECTVQPLVELQEKDVPTGTSDETKLYELLSDSYSLSLLSLDKLYNLIFMQLYRWGKDVTNNPMWKARSKDSVIEFWQGKSGKIRMICRENLTEKLRLNQFVPIDIKLIEKDEISCQWGPSIDETIAQEEFNQGLSQWAIKFETLETCKKFQEMPRGASENNKIIKDNN
ncbi:hypothetical protein RFI_28490, partial [Reticulomyxa filosa]